MFGFEAQLSFRLLRGCNKKLPSQSTIMSFFGLMIGVAALMVSMAVISGFETTLKKSVADSAGHLTLFKMLSPSAGTDELLENIKKWEPQILASSPFVLIEGVVGHKGKLSGVFLQGLEVESLNRVLGLERRLVEGKFLLGKDGDLPLALIGKGLAQNFNLKVGDEFKIVIPLLNELDPTQSKRRMGNFKVSGIIDIGKYEYDQRMIVTSIEATQELADIDKKFSGYIFKLKDLDKAREVSQHLSLRLGPQFRFRDWREINENLFDAVIFEKIGIFFVIFVIVIAASFNVASSLYINVVQKYGEIAILKTLGISEKKLIRIFSFQGFLMGFIGSLGGLILGYFLCFLVTFVEAHWGLIPGSVYKIDHIDLQVRVFDLLVIVSSTVLICFVATLAPAYRGARLTIIEGLRNV